MTPSMQLDFELRSSHHVDQQIHDADSKCILSLRGVPIGYLSREVREEWHTTVTVCRVRCTSLLDFIQTADFDLSQWRT